MTSCFSTKHLNTHPSQIYGKNKMKTEQTSTYHLVTAWTKQIHQGKSALENFQNRKTSIRTIRNSYTVLQESCSIETHASTFVQCRVIREEGAKEGGPSTLQQQVSVVGGRESLQMDGRTHIATILVWQISRGILFQLHPGCSICALSNPRGLSSEARLFDGLNLVGHKKLKTPMPYRVKMRYQGAISRDAIWQRHWYQHTLWQRNFGVSLFAAFQLFFS